MVTHQPMKFRKKRHWVLALILLALGIGWYWHEEEDEAPPVVVQEPELVTPMPAVTEADAGVEVDAGAVVELHPVDAGTPVAVARSEPDVEEYMRRWKAALAPLFRNSRALRPTELLRASPRETVDAGVEPCAPKVQRLAFSSRPRVDLVVVIDTSGSMRNALPKIARWLGELEFEIVKSNADTQLLVVAEQRDLRRAPVLDGGSYNLRVGSSDSLDVLIAAGGRPGRDRWVDALRTSADLHIVVVTDDAARGTAPDYVARLTEILDGVRFSVHVLGGLEAPAGELLAPTDPPSERECRGDGLRGLNAGEAYQEAARLTNGLRASLCYVESRRALSEALLQVRPQSNTCGWLLEAGYRLDRVEAVGPNRAPSRLLFERGQVNCRGARRSYRLAEPLLALCEETCVALKAEGYEAIEVSLVCAP